MSTFSPKLLIDIACDKRTDDAPGQTDDEVFFVIHGHDESHNYRRYEYPGNNGYINLHPGADSDPGHRTGEFQLYAVPQKLAPGQRTKIVVEIWDSDTDKVSLDDLIGSFTVYIAHEPDGHLNASFGAGAHVRSGRREPNGNLTHEFRFDGNDSDYVAWLRLT